jgi:predicted transposase/invertase (TIGR01784 family)
MRKNRTPKHKPRIASDNLCKYLTEKYPALFILWLFGVKVKSLKILKTEIIREPIRADAVILVETEDTIFHIEFQTTVKSDPPIEFRMLDYYVGLKRKFFGKKIEQILVVLKDTGEPVPDRYEDEKVSSHFYVVKMWEEDATKLLKHKELLPLAVLCRAKDEKKLLKDVADKIIKIKNKNERREQLNIAQMFAGLRFSGKLIYEALRGGDMLEESVIVQDWMQRGLQKGLQQGLQQGLQREKRLVMKQLERRFGKLSQKRRKQVKDLSIEEIEMLGETIFDLEDKAELTKWLDKHSR